MKLLRKKYISCEVTDDPTQAYILNNHQVDPSTTVPHLCLKRQAAEMDFFIRTAQHQVNVLIGEKELKFSCFPAVDVSINGRNVSCQQDSTLNPSVRTLHSFKMEQQEFIEEAINSYKFLANLLEKEESQVHQLEDHLVQTGPFDFISTPLRNLGRKIGIHHSSLLKMFLYGLLVLLLIAMVLGISWISNLCWTLHKMNLSCAGIIKKFACCKKEEESSTPASTQGVELSPMRSPPQTGNATMPILRGDPLESTPLVEPEPFISMPSMYPHGITAQARPEKPPPSYFKVQPSASPARLNLVGSPLREGPQPTAPTIAKSPSTHQVYPQLDS